MSAVRIIDFQVGRLLELTFCPSPVEPFLAAASRFPTGTTSYSVTFASASGGVVAGPTPFDRPPVTTVAAPSTGKDDSAVYLFGGINAAVGSRPTLNIDAKVDFHPSIHGFGIKAAALTDNRKKVDPDSFSAKLDYVHVINTPAVLRPGAARSSSRGSYCTGTTPASSSTVRART